MPAASNTPHLTVPQWLAFAVFAVFVLFSFLSSDKQGVAVTPDELHQIRLLSLFVIGALLPSDALVRFGRNLLFQSVDDAQEAASQAPATTLAQLLVFGTFMFVAVLTLVSNTLISSDEFAQINEVGRVLIVALLPSDAGIRFGRALYYRAGSTPSQPTAAQLKRM